MSAAAHSQVEQAVPPDPGTVAGMQRAGGDANPAPRGA